ncbi:MAG TPA: DedA family protein [Polyangia bacterium]
MESLIEHLHNLPPASVHLTLAGILLLCGLGLPIPEDISLITAGYMAHRGVVNVHTAFIVSFAAVLGGDTLAFFFGRHYGRRFLAWKQAQRVFTARKQLRVRAYFRKFGSKVIFIGRFLPGLRFLIFFSAGTLCVRPAVFLIFDTLAALVSVPFLVYLAWAFGEHIDHVIAWVRRSEYGILAVAGAAVIIVAFKIVRARRLKRRELACLPSGASQVALATCEPLLTTPRKSDVDLAAGAGKPVGKPNETALPEPPA